MEELITLSIFTMSVLVYELIKTKKKIKHFIIIIKQH